MVRRAPGAVAGMVISGLCGVSAADWPSPPLPPHAAVTSVARRVIFNGLAMRAQVFSSSASPRQLIVFYQRAWKDRVVVNRLGAATVIGRKVGHYFITVQVSAADSGSRGQIGVVDLASLPPDYKPGEGFALPMGAQVYNDISYPDDPTPARTVAMSDRYSPAQNAGFFREHLLASGWKASGGERCRSNDCVVRYARGKSTLTLIVYRSSPGRSQVVLNIRNPPGAFQ